MANTTVSIRERIKTADGRWGWSPKTLIPEGKLKTTDAQRRGNFYLVWTEKGKKRESKVKDRTFESAIKAARTKERHLEDSADGFKRPDPLHPNDRKTIADSIERYLQRVETSQDPQTLKAYRQSLRQFQRWTTLTYMDEIDHEHVMAFRKNAESKGNSRLTVDWKAMRVNKFVKVTLGLADGKGPIKKSDLGKMKPNGPPKIYTKNQIEGFFKGCTPDEELRYRSLYEPAFRKKELIYLEKEDVLVEQQMLRVQSKIRYDEKGNLLYRFKAKANSERNVPITKELMQRIVNHMNDPAQQNSRLVFCTRTGLPDTHPWDKLQTIAKRVGMGKLDLKRFRATRATEDVFYASLLFFSNNYAMSFGEECRTRLIRMVHAQLFVDANEATQDEARQHWRECPDCHPNLPCQGYFELVKNIADAAGTLTLRVNSDGSFDLSDQTCPHER